MLLSPPDGNRVPARKLHQTAVHNELAPPICHCDHLVFVLVHMIILRAACIDSDMLRERSGPVCIFAVVIHLILTPAPLFVHRPVVDIFHMRFDIRTFVLVRHKDSVLPCRNDNIPRAEHHDRDRELVDHMGIDALLPHDDISDALLLHLLRQCVPCADILPRAAVWHNRKCICLLDYLIVKTVLFQISIALHNISEVPAAHISVRKTHQIF